MKKKNILQINHSFAMGGVESMIVQLSNNIDSTQCDLSVCSIADDLEMTKRLINNVPVYCLGYKIKQIRGWRLILNFVFVICKLGKLIKQVDPDIVHVHSYFTHYLFMALAVRFYSPKTIVVKTIHTSGLFYRNDTPINKFRVLVEKIATSLNKTHLVAISGEVMQQTKDLFSKSAVDIHLIYNGVDIDKFKKQPQDALKKRLLGNQKILAVYVARVVEGKNHLFLVSLWKEMAEKGRRDIRLLIVGDGELKEIVETEINNAGLTDEIVCIGRSNEVPQILSACDFALFPSDYEGFSISLIEYTCSSLPVLCSDIPPFREVVKDGINGYIIPLSQPELWTERIMNIADDNDLRKTIGDNAYRRSKNFSAEIMANNYTKLYYAIG